MKKMGMDMMEQMESKPDMENAQDVASEQGAKAMLKPKMAMKKKKIKNLDDLRAAAKSLKPKGA